MKTETEHTKDEEAATTTEHEWRYPIGPCKIGGSSYDVASEIVRGTYEITFVCPHCQRIFKRASTNRDMAYQGILSDIQWHVMDEHSGS